MRIFVITILSLLPASSLGGNVLCDRNCPKNEIYSRCAGPSQPDCWNRNVTNTNCMPGCVCGSGFIRDPNTFVCVPYEKCPPPPKNSKTCPLNEDYSECGGGCQRTCDTLNVAFKCKCVPGCVCKGGYVRSPITGKCIRVDDCKACAAGYKRNIDTNKCEFCCQECPENEEFKECGTYCEADCFPKNILCINLCKRGCFCKSGYVRGTDGKCIPREWCPKCPANESYSCGNPLCEKTCTNYKEKCTIVNIRCEDKCYCNDGYVRDQSGKCIKPLQCKPVVKAT